MRRPATALAAVLALVAGAPPALASGTDVIRDCTDDEVMARTYTQQEYRDALAKLPADADQYGNCRDIIARAQEASATKGGSKSARKGGVAGGAATPGGGGPGGRSAPATQPSSQPASDQLAAAPAADRAAAHEAARTGSTAAVGPGNPVAGTQGVGRAPGASQLSDLPAPVLALVALLLAGTLAVAAVRIRSLVHARRA